MPATLKAPFPAFGGKSKVGPLVWQRLGDPDNYIEPFYNSGAVHLMRPHAPRIETVNDLNCYIANFWRATAADPGAVACFADNPVNEADLHARHRFLVLGQDADEFRNLLRRDPHYYDVRFAGYWVWGCCCWIGPDWCKVPEGDELSKFLPKLGQFSGKLVPECSNNPRKGLRDNCRPQLADAFSRGRGVNGNDSAGTCQQRREWLCEWFNRLRDRMRTVRVCCGDWKRVCDSPSVTTRLGLTGVFLDAPYKTQLDDGTENRAGGLYANDKDQNVNKLVDDVIDYCADRGSNPQMRIAACCYEGEGYERLAKLGWTVESWTASGGYGNNSGKVNENASRERIWFSPHCKPPEQKSLFATHELN